MIGSRELTETTGLGLSVTSGVSAEVAVALVIVINDKATTTPTTNTVHLIGTLRKSFIILILLLICEPEPDKLAKLTILGGLMLFSASLMSV
ncbi:hypothetical protein SDC9_175921 [bioreactor metagenome]|uniref:Uncharacterized protein n=1 Tax=bioreactor metagenome TaxID=1076179 RepID=A0A645GRL5_9ZZZZ